MTIRRLLLLILVAAAPLARAANWPEHPILHAVRATSAPAIDGDLSDPVWQTAPEFTGFTQHDPDDGKPAAQRTSVRILYDDKAIYFGATMSDAAPPTALLARRDVFINADFLSINIDSQHDRLSGAAFTVTPANEQIDSILYNDIGEDGSWDAVWESAVKIVPDGWVAEVRVPYSQLRFPDKPVHVWGINITRRTTRTNEVDRIVNTLKGQTGFVSHFADVDGIEGIHRGKPFEVVPYSVVRDDVLSRSDPGDPFLRPERHRAEAGVDLKYALTSSLTLTGTVNPDFGQVEVDPAVVNLSAFETFYPEKRPFFTEGLNIFNFGDSPARSHFSFIDSPSIFYSRRIGRAPQESIAADFVDVPAQSRILGAAKVTGKVGPWAIGVLDALTNSVSARFAVGGVTARQKVEPLSNYFVSRETRELGTASRVGIMVTNVTRDLPDELSDLRHDATTVGTDGYTAFPTKDWVLEWSAVRSRVRGSAESIAATQQSSAHYFQRPDATSFHFDPNRTSLDGWGARTALAKQTGIWRPNVGFQAFSPGYETNDIGFMERTNLISSHALMQYSDERPTARFREKDGWFGVWVNRNFDGDTIERGLLAETFGIFTSYWRYDASFSATSSALSDDATRGGPLLRVPATANADASLSSDDRKRFFFRINSHAFRTRYDGSWLHSYTVELNYRPSPSLIVSLAPSFRRAHNANQYVTTVSDPTASATYGADYVFGQLDERTFELGTRVDWTLTPRLSFQLYAQPFLAAGDYHDYHALARPRTADYVPYAGAVDDPSFNFRSVRASGVVRWEFRPGSALYVVWNENRAGSLPFGDFRFGRDLRGISDVPSHDVFLVKLSYWLPM
jgi:hypothetical protein